MTFEDLLKDLREQSAARAAEWEARGAEARPDLEPWTPDHWFTALLGEVGEAANLMKKLFRGFGNKESEVELHDMLARELADCVIYLDIFAREMGVNLWRAYEGWRADENDLQPLSSLACCARRLGVCVGSIAVELEGDDPTLRVWSIGALLDTLCCTADWVEIDLNAAVIRAFNAKSEELGFPQRIGGAG